MQALKLIAFDDEDLAVISSHLQDAVMRVAEMAYLPAEKRFAAILNRFNWEKALKEGSSESHERRRCALRFDRVLGAQCHNLKPGARSRVLSLLAIGFEQTDAPEGYVTLIFSGDSAIRLHVECIEAEMRDLGLAWQTQNKPRHAEGEPGAAGT
jgi:hypothetical protein